MLLSLGPQPRSAGAGNPWFLAWSAWLSQSSRSMPRLRAVPATVSMRSTNLHPPSLSAPREAFRQSTALRMLRSAWLMASLKAQDWVVYLKKTFHQPEKTLQYLGRAGIHTGSASRISTTTAEPHATESYVIRLTALFLQRLTNPGWDGRGLPPGPGRDDPGRRHGREDRPTALSMTRTPGLPGEFPSSTPSEPSQLGEPLNPGGTENP